MKENKSDNNILILSFFWCFCTGFVLQAVNYFVKDITLKNIAGILMALPIFLTLGIICSWFIFRPIFKGWIKNDKKNLH